MSASSQLAGTELLGFAVPINEIDKRMTEVITGGDDSENSGITRASMLNLALYSERPGELTDNAEMIAEITRDAACRTLLITVDPAEAKSKPQAWVQAHCQSDKNGNKSICSEQISFVLSGDSPGLVRNMVFSHLDSDLPLVFWWKGEFSDSFEERLYSRIDRFVFDSEQWANPRNQFMRLQEASHSGQANFICHDLAFTRLNSHRQAISNAFDIPGLRNAMNQIEGMKIQYPKDGGMSALYLAAWFSHRLAGELDRTVSTPGKYVFRSTQKGCPSEMFVEMEEVEGCDFAAAVKVGHQLIELTRCPDRDYLRTKIMNLETNEGTEDWLPNPRQKDARLMTYILERGGRNRSLPKLIEKVSELLTL